MHPMFCRFFMALNNKLFQGLERAMQTSAVLRPAEFGSRFGLHPSDYEFLSALVTILNLNHVTIEPERRWLSCCC